jgi:hypothetical protein
MQETLFLKVYKSKDMSANNLFSSFELKEGQNYLGKSFFLSNIILSLKSIADIHFCVDVYKRPALSSTDCSSNPQISFDLEIMDDSNQNVDDFGRILRKNKVYFYTQKRVFYLVNQYACVIVPGDSLNLTKQKISKSLLSKCFEIS